MYFFSCSNSRHPRHLRRSVYVAFLVFCSFSQLSRAEGGNSTSRSCDKSKIQAVIVAGALKNRFVAIIQSLIMVDGKGQVVFCAYDMPLKSLSGKKLYLSGGSELAKKWPDLAKYFGDGEGMKYRGTTVLDAQNSWLYLTTGSYAKIFNLDTKKVYGIFEKGQQSLNFISSTKKLELYKISGPMNFAINRMNFTGSKTFTEVQDLVLDPNYFFSLCQSDDKHLNAIKKGEQNSCKHGVNGQDWSSDQNNLPWANFNDGKKFYVTGHKHVYIFDQEIFGSKLGQSVPFEKVERNNFYVYGSSPVGPGPGTGEPDVPNNDGSDGPKKGHSSLSVIIVVIVLLIILAVAVYFLWFKPGDKNKKSDPSKEKSLSGKGKRSASPSKAGKVAGGKSFKLSKRNSFSRGGSSKGKKDDTELVSKVAVSTSKKRSISKRGTSTSKRALTPSSSRKMSTRKASQSRKISGITAKAKTTRSRKLSSRKMSKSRKA